MAAQARLSYLAIAAVLEEIMSGATTVAQLAEHSGLTARYCRQFMNALHAKKLVHVASWEPDRLGRNCVPAYALGYGKDAPRKPKTRKEINAAWRARNAARQLSGTPFYGLGARAANDAVKARA